MFGSIIASVAGSLVDKIIGPFLDLGKAYFNKQISIEELRARMVTALVASAADVEKTHAQELSKTFESFQVTLRQSRLVQIAWAATLFSQLAVLLWHQLGIPAFVYLTGKGYPSSGSTVEWSYALIGFLLGAGALIFRSGPGAFDASKWKALIGK